MYEITALNITALNDDHAYHWHGYGTYCGRCLRRRCAPRGALTPLINTKGVQCRTCGRLLRSSRALDHTGLARINALTGADLAGLLQSGVGLSYEKYGFPPAHAGLPNPHRRQAA